MPAPDKLSPSAVLHAFKDKLPLHLRSRLEAHRQLKAARAESAPAWDDLVNIVRDDRNGGSMLSAAERAAISGATTRKVTPAVSVASLTSVSEVGAVNSALLPAAGTIAAVQPGTNRPVCPLCTRLGADFTNHTLETCYCNPASKEYRPDIRYRRIMQARRRGITVP